jgi:indole-3-glycerol phosphate synthase
MPKQPAFDVAALVPSSRDFLQAVRTARKGLALVPCLPKEQVAREALRMAEADVAALAMSDVGPAMVEAAGATRLPMLSLSQVSSADAALAARAHGADAVLIDPDAGDAEREAATNAARSTHMAALPVARTRKDVEKEVARGGKVVVVEAPDLKGLSDLASLAGRLIVIARSSGRLEDDVRLLRGKVDAVVVGVEVYGETGFERLVSELNP